jgi:uncharacterized protein
MSLSLYDVSVPAMITGLKALDAVLDKGAGFAATAGIAEADLVGRRLWPDMMSLSGQVQRASDTARYASVRVGGAADVSMPDNETTLAQLRQRVQATIAYLEGVDPKGYDGRENAEVVLPVPGKPRHYTGREYILHWAVPNFWFHVTTAYDLLRHAGVPIGKRHFLGWE